MDDFIDGKLDNFIAYDKIVKPLNRRESEYLRRSEMDEEDEEVEEEAVDEEDESYEPQKELAGTKQKRFPKAKTAPKKSLLKTLLESKSPKSADAKFLANLIAKIKVPPNFRSNPYEVNEACSYAVAKLEEQDKSKVAQLLTVLIGNKSKSQKLENPRLSQLLKKNSLNEFYERKSNLEVDGLEKEIDEIELAKYSIKREFERKMMELDLKLEVVQLIAEAKNNTEFEEKILEACILEVLSKSRNANPFRISIEEETAYHRASGYEEETEIV